MKGQPKFQLLDAPPKGTVSRVERYNELRDFARKHPGKWIRIPHDYPKGNAATAAWKMRHSLSWAGFEFRSRRESKGQVESIYVCFTGSLDRR